ncbi:MAG: hypothetical protein GVY24_00750 [Planctomycetes bacterium]|jgi:hypothetical protein|nr:hypothetical protein [Planctomycetota bacterium]
MPEETTDLITLEPVDRVDLMRPFTRDYDLVPTSRGPYVVVEYLEETINVWGLAVHYHPEIVSGLTGLLALAAWLWWWRWRRKRPQARPGEPYCRRCGYGLTGVVSAQCPECGAALNDRTVRTARRGRLRTTLTAVFITLMLAAASVWLIWGPPRDHDLGHELDWPSAWARRLTAGHLGTWSDPLLGNRHVLQTVHTPDGRRRTIARGRDIDQSSWPDPMPHRFEVVVKHPEHLAVIDLATGRERGRITPPQPGQTFGGVYVSRHGRVIHCAMDDRYYRWDADTLVPLKPIDEPALLHDTWWWYFECPIDRGVMVMVEEERLIRVDPRGQVLYTIRTPDGASGFSNQWPTSSDGTRAFLRTHGGHADRIYEYDLTDGTLRRTWRLGSPVERCELSLDGRLLVVASETSAGDAVAVWSVAGQRKVADLQLPKSGNWEIENVDFSDDDRRVIVFAKSASSTSPTVLSYEATGIPRPVP